MGMYRIEIEKKKGPAPKGQPFIFGSGGKIRTYDRSINSRLLYH